MADNFELVRQGALDVDKLTAEELNELSDGATLLHAAIAYGQDSIALALIKKGINLNAQNKKGETALFYAATYQNQTVAEALIRAGANVNLPNKKYKNTPLWAALLSLRKDYALFDFILKNGGDATIKNFQGNSCLDLIKRENITPLFDLIDKFQKYNQVKEK